MGESSGPRRTTPLAVGRENGTWPRRAVTWGQRYARVLATTDFLVIVWAVLGAQILRFGLSTDEQATISRDLDLGLSYTLVSLVLILGWMAVLSAFGTRDARVAGIGFAEYRLIVDATIRLFGVGAIFVFLFKIDIARSYILIALPAGLTALLLTRWIWRQWLHSQRRRGGFSYRVLLVGSLASVVAIARDLARFPAAGYEVVSAVVPDAPKSARLPGTTVPVTHDLAEIPTLMDAKGAETLIITSSDQLPPGKIRELSWALEPGRQHLVVAPSLTDVGGPRIRMRPVVGLPLMHVETPRYEGLKRVTKRAFDLAVTTVLILLLSPLLLAIALVVRFSSHGPVLFRQPRVGRAGKLFPMLKFRSMVVDAEDRLSELQGNDRDAGNDVMFKLKDDPRVTPVGKWLRRYSLDELPQLFNVFVGQMSIVGPRPPLPREVELYESHVHRRFLVKPGITGLWQVSGRSSLSWEDTVRLDLYYVENWSVTGDLIILWRTAKAVVGRDGAY
ncbi:sugar transferase [Protaetiibacter larvae]|uniref:sugar transferase n=1 Tax=Protaetiibacter larvae TaxID=2592654 RepID=UPI00143DD09B|nr:sugar transferase [Protaetiibacter larvae]